MSEQMPDVIWSYPNNKAKTLGYWNNIELEATDPEEVKYLKASHVEATTVPKAEHDLWVADQNQRIAMQQSEIDQLKATTVPKAEYNDAIYQRDLAKRDRNTADNRYAKLLTYSVPRDKVEALITETESLIIMLEAREHLIDLRDAKRAIAAIRSLEDKG